MQVVQWGFFVGTWNAMSTTRTKPNLCEIVTFGSAPIINEETGVIEGVKILGENSKNGRRYKPEAMREAAPLYEGVKSYINHPRKSELSDDRDFAKWSGIFEGVHYLEGKGLFGNFRLRKEGPHFREIIEAARDFPQHAGFSHVAEGKSRREGNTESRTAEQNPIVEVRFALRWQWARQRVRGCRHADDVKVQHHRPTFATR